MATEPMNIENFIPKKFKNNPLFEKIVYLLNYYNSKWTDEEISNYLKQEDFFYRIEENIYNIDFTKKNIYLQYPTELADIWYEFSRLNNKTVDREGIQYWGHVLEPFVGTNLIQEKMIEKSELNGSIKEWFDYGMPKNTYTIYLDKFPGYEMLELLLKTSFKLKNVESKLLSITNGRCPGSLILSVGSLNKDKLSGPNSKLFFGVSICFVNNYGYVDNNIYEYLDIDRNYYAFSHLKIFDANTYDTIYDKDTQLRMYAETIPGLNFNTIWDEESWTTKTWENGSYVDRVREIVNDDTFKFTVGKGLYYPGFGYPTHDSNNLSSTYPSIYEPEVFFEHTTSS